MPHPHTTAATRAILGSDEFVTVPAPLACNVLDVDTGDGENIEYTCYADGRVKRGTEVLFETGGQEVIDFCQRQRERLGE
jgi:hypothetical protein